MDYHSLFFVYVVSTLGSVTGFTIMISIVSIQDKWKQRKKRR